MEFTNEIFFNKPLTAGSTVIITYSGKLYREHSKDVSIVYGYGDNWEFTDSSPMVETENGFEVTITLRNYNTFNFCFSNSFNIWDNNFGYNYIAPILQKESNDQISDNTQNSDDINSIENVTEEDSDTSADSQDTAEEVENIIEENEDVKNTEIATFKQDEIESQFSSLIDSLLNDIENDNKNVDITNLEGFGLQSVDTVKEEDTFDCDDFFAKLFDELTMDSKKENIKTTLEENDTNILKAETTSEETNMDTSKTETASEETVETNTDVLKAETTFEETNIDTLKTEMTTEETDTYTSKPEMTSENVLKAEPIIENIESNDYYKMDNSLDYNKYEVEDLDNLMESLLESISNFSENKDYSTPIEKIETDNLENVGLPAVQQPQEDWVDKIINISYNFTKKVTSTFKKIGKLIKSKAKEYGFINNEK